MKKLLFVLVFVSAITVAYAENPRLHNLSEETGIFSAEWTAFQLSLVPEKYGQLFDSRTNVYGLGIGAFTLENDTCVFTVASTSGQNKNYGLQCAAVTVTNDNCGLDVGAVFSTAEKNYGLQIGAINMETVKPVKAATEQEKDTRGVQLGACNLGYGFQIAAFNFNLSREKEARGIQVGVFNIGSGRQFGLLNFNKDAKFFCFPFVNFPQD